jgi:hypothetical protein
MPFAASITTRSGFSEPTSTNALDEPVPDVLFAKRAPRGTMPGTGHGAVADVEQPRLPTDGERTAADDLHPGVLLRIVRRRDHDPPVELEVADREIEHLRADHPEVEDICARVGCALAGGGRHRRRRETHVAPDGDARRRELVDVRTADRVGAGLVELLGVEAAHVIRLEHRRIEHCGAG